MFTIIILLVMTTSSRVCESSQQVDGRSYERITHTHTESSLASLTVEMAAYSYYNMWLCSLAFTK